MIITSRALAIVVLMLLPLFAIHVYASLYVPQPAESDACKNPGQR